MKTLSPEWPEVAWHFPQSRFAEMKRAATANDELGTHLLNDEDAAKWWMLNRICRIYDLETTSDQQRRWLRFRWARYCRLRRWYALGNALRAREDLDYAADIREIEREIAVAETRIEAMLGTPAAAPSRVREAV